MSTVIEATESKQDPSYVPHGPVTAELNFFIPPKDGAVPFNYVEEPPAGQPKRNFQSQTVAVPIDDIRSKESSFTLDVDGFQALQGKPTAAAPEFTDEENIKTVYYPEIEKLIRDNVPGATKTFIFDHTIRRSEEAADRTPVFQVHIDQSLESTRARVKLHLPPHEADHLLLNSRYRIINVWRPLNGPVQATPLAMASAASVGPGILSPVEHRYPARTGQTVGVTASPDLKWYYWSGMVNDEVLLLKCSDSADVPGKGTPHSAFVDPRTPDGARGRASIEVRVLVFG